MTSEQPAMTPPPSVGQASQPIDIVLLMKLPEAAFCSAALRRLDADLRIGQAGSVADIERALPLLSNTARLIGFSTSVVVPGRLLPAFKGGAFNFHPGPPEYPGNRPSAFACYAQARRFGVTFHRMITAVDAGEILDCDRFSTEGMDTAGAYALEAYQRLARLFLRNAADLARRDHRFTGNGEVWSGRKTTLAEFNAMRCVPRGIDPDELALRIRCFGEVYSSVD